MKHYWYLNYLNCCIFWSFFVSIFREKVKSREETLAANAAAKSLSLFEYAWKHFKWTTFSNKVLSSALTITVSLSLSLSHPSRAFILWFCFLDTQYKRRRQFRFRDCYFVGIPFPIFFCASFETSRILPTSGYCRPGSKHWKRFWAFLLLLDDTSYLSL